jgi:predicted nucleotidyltransferase
MAVKRLVDSLRRAVADLESARADWAIVGGLAVSARTEPRTTRDVDFAVAVDGDADAESIARALMRLGYEIGAGIEQTDTGRLASLRLWPPGDRRRVVMIDLLFASSGIEAEIVSAAERLELVAGTTVPVATIAHLLAMKVLSRDDRRRPQDRVDIGALLRFATDEDVESARVALALVTHRGFARGRDLDAALTTAIAELSDG